MKCDLCSEENHDKCFDCNKSLCRAHLRYHNCGCEDRDAAGNSVIHFARSRCSNGSSSFSACSYSHLDENAMASKRSRIAVSETRADEGRRPNGTKHVAGSSEQAVQNEPVLSYLRLFESMTGVSPAKSLMSMHLSTLRLPNDNKQKWYWYCYLPINQETAAESQT